MRNLHYPVGIGIQFVPHSPIYEYKVVKDDKFSRVTSLWYCRLDNIKLNMWKKWMKNSYRHIKDYIRKLYRLSRSDIGNSQWGPESLYPEIKSIGGLYKFTLH